MIDKQIKAARAFLGWTRDDLAGQSGVSTASIQNIEDGQSFTQRTLDKLRRAFLNNGVLLTEDGVRMPDTATIKLDGEGWFIDLLDDALHTLKTAKNKDFLVFGSDPTVSPPAVVERLKAMTEAGITVREIIKEGNTYMMGNEANYRWVSKDYFENFVTVIYGDKTCLDYGTHGILTISRDRARADRKWFELLWSYLPPVSEKSTANERY